MSGDLVPTGEKEYWHDKRLASNRAAASARQGPDPQSADSPVSPVVSPPKVRTYRNLRHPIASFVLVVLAVILVGVGLLAVTGNGALSVPPLKLAAEPVKPAEARSFYEICAGSFGTGLLIHAASGRSGGIGGLLTNRSGWAA
jgi:hypothetical protein